MDEEKCVLLRDCCYPAGYSSEYTLFGVFATLRETLFPETPMTENEMARIVVDAAFQIHVKLGPGLLESAYQAILAHELRKRGLHVDYEQPVPIEWDGLE